MKKTINLFFIAMLFLYSMVTPISGAFAEEGSPSEDEQFLRAVALEELVLQSEEGQVLGTLPNDSTIYLQTKNGEDFYLQWGENTIPVPMNSFILKSYTDMDGFTPVGEEETQSYLLIDDLTTVIDDKAAAFVSINKDQIYPIQAELEDSYEIIIGNRTGYISKSEAVTLLPEDNQNSEEPVEETETDKKEESVEAPTEESGEKTLEESANETLEKEKTGVESLPLKEEQVTKEEALKIEAAPTQTKETFSVASFTSSVKFFQVTGDNVDIFDNSSGSLVKVGSLEKGQVYPRVSDYGANWHKIKFGNGYGFVASSKTIPANSTSLYNINTQYSNSSTKVTAIEDLPVYDNTSGALVKFATISKGENYPIISDYGANWYRVDVSGRTGYVLQSLTKKPFTANDHFFRVIEDDVKVFDNSTGTLIEVGTLMKGQSYPRVAAFGSNWHQVRFGSGYGYVYVPSTAPASGSDIKNIYVSSNSNTGKQVVTLKEISVFDNSSGTLLPFASLHGGKSYSIISETGNWYTVNIAGRLGYIYKYDTRIPLKESDKFFRVTDNNVKLYTNDAGILVEVGTLAKDQVYPRIAAYGANWHQVRFGNTYAYVYAGSTSADSGSSVKNINTNLNFGNKVVTALNDVVVVDNSSGALVPFFTLKAHTSISYIATSGNWFIVDVAGRTGYVHNSNVRAGFTVATPSLEVYSSFEDLSNYTRQNSSVFLSFGEQVEIISENQYAVQIRSLTSNVTGWVQRDYLVNDPGNVWWYVKEGRNLRSEPHSLSANLGYISDKTTVRVLDYKYGTETSVPHWYKIQTTDGKIGWIWGGGVNGSNVIRYESNKIGATTNEITIFTPLNTASTATASQLNAFIHYATNGNTSSYMYDMGEAFLEAQRLTGLNAIYLLAHSALETGYGTSSIVKSKYNYYGIHAFDACPSSCASEFEGKAQGIIGGADWISRNYVNRDAYQQFTIDNMRNNNNTHQYATDEAWHVKIANIAKNFLNFISGK